MFLLFVNGNAWDLTSEEIGFCIPLNHKLWVNKLKTSLVQTRFEFSAQK